ARPVLGQLVLHQGQCPPRLGIPPPAVFQGSAIEERDNRARQHHGGNAQHHPAVPVDELTPPGKHLSPPPTTGVVVPWRRPSSFRSGRRWPRRRQRPDPSPSAGRCHAGCPRCLPRSPRRTPPAARPCRRSPPG